MSRTLRSYIQAVCQIPHLHLLQILSLSCCWAICHRHHVVPSAMCHEDAPELGVRGCRCFRMSRCLNISTFAESVLPFWPVTTATACTVWDRFTFYLRAHADHLCCKCGEEVGAPGAFLRLFDGKPWCTPATTHMRPFVCFSIDLTLDESFRFVTRITPLMLVLVTSSISELPLSLVHHLNH